MKRPLLTLSLLLITGIVFCQKLTISGTIKGANKNDSVEVNIPFGGYYWKQNSYFAKPNAAGNFSLLLPYHTTVLAILNYRSASQFVLLSPGRPFVININADKNTYNFSGAATPENALLKRLKIQGTDSLSFVKEAKKGAYLSYVGWSMDSIFRIKLPAIRHSLDSTERIVNAAAIPQALKSIIRDEVKFCYARGVADNLGGWLNNGQYRQKVAEFNTRFIDTVWATFGLPTKQQLNTGIWANLYLENYFKFKTWKPLYLYKATKDKQQAEKILVDNWGVTMKDLQNDPDNDNERYMLSTRLKKVLPAYAWQKLLANELTVFCMQSQLMAADKMLNFIKTNVPEDPYIAYCEKAIAPMKAHREQYASNLNIKIRAGYRDINSLQKLLEPYKGKVVLVDMWGTWCPHCIEDMAYEPALKKRFENKDVVFLYLANDEEKNDEKWRDFIFINDLTGEHVRRTTEQIAPMWNEIGIKDSEQAYPHYFIVGKQGNILIKDAKRPGTDTGLYDQIEGALNDK